MTKYPPLRELRAAIVLAGYRFDRFADKVGLTPDYFNHQLAGRKKPHPELLRRAADLLQCEVADIEPRELVAA